MFHVASRRPARPSARLSARISPRITLAPPPLRVAVTDDGTYEVLDGWWTDAGTFESLLHANTLVAKTGANKMPHGNCGPVTNPQGVAR